MSSFLLVWVGYFVFPGLTNLKRVLLPDLYGSSLQFAARSKLLQLPSPTPLDSAPFPPFLPAIGTSLLLIFSFSSLEPSWIVEYRMLCTLCVLWHMCRSMACLATSKQNRTVRKQRSKMCLQTRRSAEIMSKWRQEPRWQLLWRIYLNLLRSEALHRLLMYREGFATTKFCFQKNLKAFFYETFASTTLLQVSIEEICAWVTSGRQKMSSFSCAKFSYIILVITSES